LANDPGAPPVPREPELVFTHLASNLRLRFLAVPTHKRGVLRARVTLPKAGAWTLYVWAYDMGAVAPAPSSREIVVRPPRRRQARNVATVTQTRPVKSATVPAVRSGR
jgi:phosphatidylserine/phosphatidylglycerophosphate/cardiolipin synthase-like enzyme